MSEGLRDIFGADDLSDANDPEGSRRRYLGELEAFTKIVDPTAELTVSDEGATIAVIFAKKDERMVEVLARYETCFEPGELEEFVEIGQRYQEIVTERVLDVPDLPEGDLGALSAERNRQIVLSVSLAVSRQLEDLLMLAIEGSFREALADAAEEEDDDGEDEAWDIGTASDPEGTIDVGDPADDAPEIEVDPNILDEARSVRIDMNAVNTLLVELEDYFKNEREVRPIQPQTPGYERAVINASLIALSAYGPSISLDEYMDLRAFPEMKELLSSLPDDEAEYCFLTVARNIAEAALQKIPSFEDAIKRCGMAGHEIDDVVNAYADALLEG